MGAEGKSGDGTGEKLYISQEPIKDEFPTED
jgi:hypothetical protein